LLIRRVIAEDARGVAAIHVRSWQAAYRGLVPESFLRSLSIEHREATWRELLENRTSDVWVAGEEGGMLGWICVGKSRDPDVDATTAELWAIYVDPNRWRRGVGHALWSRAAEHLRASEFSRVTVWVLKENAEALRFYGSIGFVADPGHEKTIELGGAELVEIRLRRDVVG
jgi:ribosomal protein S18 acetylase RimI-like enzyme